MLGEENMGVEFVTDRVVDSLTCTAENVIKLLGYLCGEPIRASSEDKLLLEKLLKRTHSFNYQQINEILLLLNQDRINEGFFEFFFGAASDKLIDFGKLKEGVKNFRGFAMLKYGDF
ncbi:MAG: hypothetical protein ACE5IC_03500 [Candidatus Brocadiales bacterium]